jgi:hypothetical protein
MHMAIRVGVRMVSVGRALFHLDVRKLMNAKSIHHALSMLLVSTSRVEVSHVHAKLVTPATAQSVMTLVWITFFDVHKIFNYR